MSRIHSQWSSSRSSYASQPRHFFQHFCTAVGREDLLSDSGAEFGEHRRGDVALRRELADLFRTRTQAEWVELFLEVDVPGAPVHAPAEVIDDPQFRARMRLVEHDHPQAGPLRLLATPIRLGEPPAHPGPAPASGEHTDEILRELGYDDGRIGELRSRGAVH
jgi:crotonobetainyl-CoA:carnitine CoA-transferase CaiB-like acyl-CoA transferase